MSLFTRNLAKYGKPVEIFDRNERIINGRSSEVFTSIDTDTAIVKTLKGVTVFDSTNTERVATHRLCLAYRADVGAEQWVKLGTKYLKILTHSNVCEDSEKLVLVCTERGEDSKIANQA